MSVVELTRDGSFFLVDKFETKESALDFIKTHETQYENQGSRLMLDED